MWVFLFVDVPSKIKCLLQALLVNIIRLCSWTITVVLSLLLVFFVYFYCTLTWLVVLVGHILVVFHVIHFCCVCCSVWFCGFDSTRLLVRLLFYWACNHFSAITWSRLCYITSVWDIISFWFESEAENTNIIKSCLGFPDWWFEQCYCYSLKLWYDVKIHSMWRKRVTTFFALRNVSHRGVDIVW